MSIQWAAQIVYNKRIVRMIFVILLVIQNSLGIINTFSTMLPIPPRTSIGGMTAIAIILVVLSVWMHKKHLSKINTSPQTVDILLLLYVCTQAISLLFAPVIYQLTTFRILLIAVTQYALVRLTSFSLQEKKTIIFGLGATVFVVSLASAFQVFFRDAAITLARQALFGDAAYGVVWELLRGRAPHWGNLTIAFPFFFGSLLFVRRTSLMRSLFIIAGTLFVLFAFFVSNFRWITFCFVFSTGCMFLLLLKFRYNKLSHFVGQAVTLLVAVIAGLYFASAAFHYNLIDRFLIRNFDRDVTNTIGRLYLYQQALDVFFVSPVIGVGMGNYSNLVEPIIGVEFNRGIGSIVSETDKQPISSHNELLTVLAEGGMISLVLFIWMNVLVFMKTFRQAYLRLGHQENRLFFIMFLTSLLAYYLYGLFENTAPNNFIVIFFIYAASCTWSKSDSVVSNLKPGK